MTALWSSPEHRDEHGDEHCDVHGDERCASCAGERLFEQPACLDGHEPGECPEWACVACGHAVFLGPAECARPVRLLVTAAV
ncbi:hypothetical protein [Nonomuraea glycinis]|uniref:hypothetical protein n=1 Tax=Nonomuraea glycinis TaxID=2047744 RepID=UPI002E1026D2|nr:hypothetical protein OHA68_42835 [Nonomuraea glycinis]